MTARVDCHGQYSVYTKPHKTNNINCNTICFRLIITDSFRCIIRLTKALKVCTAYVTCSRKNLIAPSLTDLWDPPIEGCGSHCLLQNWFVYRNDRNDCDIIIAYFRQGEMKSSSYSNLTFVRDEDPFSTNSHANIIRITTTREIIMYEPYDL